MASALKTYGTLIGFVLVVLFFWIEIPDTFMTAKNWLNISQQVSMLAVVAFAMTIVMVMGDFDLSVGSMASLAGIVAALAFRDGYGVWVGVTLALVVGLVGGVGGHPGGYRKMDRGAGVTDAPTFFHAVSKLEKKAHFGFSNRSLGDEGQEA